MKKKILYALLILLIALVPLFGIVGYGMYLMEIEDHYGDYQNFHFKSKNGDILVNKSTYKIGIIEKNWKRMNIKTKDKDSTDLYSWIWKNEVETKAEVYRLKHNNLDFTEITYSDLMTMVKNKEAKLITNN